MSLLWHLDRTGSTQEVVRQLARGGAPAGTTVVARCQSAGRGRLDHAWSSPRGGLYLSRIVDGPRSHPELLPLAVALEVAKALDAGWGIGTRIRWPNDLVSAGAHRKVGGILAETVPGPGLPRSVVGIGLNVATDPSALPVEIRRIAASLADLHGGEIDLDGLERAVGRGISNAAARLRYPASARPLVRELRGRLYGLGRDVILDDLPIGRFVGVDDSGALLARTGGRVVPHRAGTLRFLPEGTGVPGSPD